MDERSEISSHLQELFPNATAELLGLLQAAEQNAAVFGCDHHTIKDWLELAGYPHESLYVLLLLMILAQAEGSLCIEVSQRNLNRRLGDFLPPEQADRWAQHLCAELARQDWSALIGTNPDDNRPVIKHIAENRTYLYFQKYLRHEQQFLDVFSAKFSASSGGSGTKDREKIMREILDKNPLVRAGRPIALDADQRRALELGLSRNLVIISGGP